MSKVLKLSEQRKQWIGNRKDLTLRGTPLAYNVSSQKKYQKALRELTQRMINETKVQIEALFNTTEAKEYSDAHREAVAMDASLSSLANKLLNKLTAKFDKMFGDHGMPLAEHMVNQADQNSATTLRESLKQLSGGLTLKTSFMTPVLTEVIKGSISENVDLIKTIPKQYLKDIKVAVFKSITTGQGLKELMPAVSRSGAISQRRVRMIALDQTRKVYNNINQIRLVKSGVKKFEWLHSGGGRQPRKDHIALNGKIFSFDNLPIIVPASKGKAAERGIPGQAINCGCTMNPVIEFDEGEQINAA